jgi:molecular chaperone HscB
MPADFLVEQMEWREAVAEARSAGEHHELEHLHHRLQRDMLERYEEIAGCSTISMIWSRPPTACGD